MKDPKTVTQLKYNDPIDVYPDERIVCEHTTQTDSILQIENLSTSNKADFFIQWGGHKKSESLNPNTAEPYRLIENFNGTKLNVMNISTRKADIKVTLKST